MRNRRVRGADDPVQLAIVQPVHDAGLAGIDDDVAGAAVGVGIHGRAAPGAMDLAVEILPVRRVGGVDGDFAAGAEVLDDFSEDVHRDQHASAALAIENTLAGDGGVGQGNGADGAGNSGFDARTPSELGSGK